MLRTEWTTRSLGFKRQGGSEPIGSPLHASRISVLYHLRAARTLQVSLSVLDMVHLDSKEDDG